MSAMAADQRLRISQEEASRIKEDFFKALEDRFVELSKTTDLQCRRNILFLAGMRIKEYIERKCGEWNSQEELQARYIPAAAIVLGYAFAASSVEEFRQRLTEYWYDRWNPVVE